MTPSFFLLPLLLLLSPISTPVLSLKGILLSCGSTAPLQINNLTYLPDSSFIAAGVPKSLPVPNLLPLLSTLRSFPFSKTPLKFCYSIPTVRGARYLVRTTYFYGSQSPPPVFDQIVDGTFWAVVNTTRDHANGMASNYEGVFLARGKFLTLCLAANWYTDSDPFINALEMIVLEDSVYNSTDFTKNAMGLVARSRFGYNGPIVRYPDDRFDRYWQPFMGNTRATSGTEDISASGFWNLPPSNVFGTALTADQDNLMELQWPPVFLPNSTYYIALYFADKSFAGTRAFDVFINDYSFYNNLKVTSSGIVLFATQWNLSGLTKITLSPLSSVPPMINAGEIFGIFSLGGITLTHDVIALDRIKKSIQNPPVDWNGDPCLPRGYSWSGVTCSDGARIRIIALNLTGMGLLGSLSPNIANLTALTNVSFANNNFSGPIPDLSQLRWLEKLHLQNNQISGVIPESLGNIKSLSELFLENNNLTGKVPANLSMRPGLTLRLLPGNNLS